VGSRGESRGRVEVESRQSRGRGSAKVQIGRRPLQRWKSGTRVQRTEYRVQSMEDGEQRGEGEGRRCKGPNQPSGCAKVERLIPKQSTEYGGKVGATPLPASRARERQLGWHAVPTLPKAVSTGVDWRTDATQSRPYQRQLGQHVVLSLPDAWGTGDRDVGKRREAARLARSANPTRGS
jgi:hypothetical protein